MFRGLTLQKRQGPVETDGVWPAGLQSKVKDARRALKAAYGRRPMIRNTLVPPNGAVGFVDELVHHSTPLMGKRSSANSVSAAQTPFLSCSAASAIVLA